MGLLAGGGCRIWGGLISIQIVPLYVRGWIRMGTVLARFLPPLPSATCAVIVCISSLKQTLHICKSCT